jgi:hypothetical protein
MRGQERAVASLFDADPTEIATASVLPLYSLLRLADLHVTHSSSTVVEAAEFGVPSLVLSRYGLELFPEQSASGMARLVDTADAIEAAIASAAPIDHRRRDDGALRALERSYALLDSLLGVGSGQAETGSEALSATERARRT